MEAYAATLQERQVLEVCTDRFVKGTAADVAAVLERLHEQTRVDEVMLVTMGSDRAAHTRTLEQLADHYGLSSE